MLIEFDRIFGRRRIDEGDLDVEGDLDDDEEDLGDEGDLDVEGDLDDDEEDLDVEGDLDDEEDLDVEGDLDVEELDNDDEGWKSKNNVWQKDMSALWENSRH